MQANEAEQGLTREAIEAGMQATGRQACKQSITMTVKTDRVL
jgi:hypothetical protein